MRENPYRLAEDVSGVGFRIADEIAGRIGIHTDSDYRIRSGILYTLLQAVGEGHCFLPLELLLRRASELLGVSEENIRPQVHKERSLYFIRRTRHRKNDNHQYDHPLF